MSLSEMSRETYLKHRASIRTNGARYTLAHIDCPLEREDMRFLESQGEDMLQLRVMFRKHDSAAVAFMLTTPLTRNMRATRF